MSLEHSFIVKEWLNTVLTNDTTLIALVDSRVFEDVAPEGTAYPFIVYNKSSEDELKTQNAYNAATTFTYNVKVVDQSTSYVTIIPTAERIDELLHRATGETTLGWIITSTRDQTLELAEIDVSGINYRHLGGIYRIMSQLKV